MKRTAQATWTGDLKDGKGSLSAPGGILKNTPYSFKTRFENEPGTNPEELIAAAHAGCFTMALSAFLSKSGFTAEKLSTEASLTLELVDNNWTISAIHLSLTGQVPSMSPEQFQTIAQEAKALCPVSRVLNATITLEAHLKS